MKDLSVSTNSMELMIEEDQSMALKWSNPMSLQHGALGNSHECGYLLRFLLSATQTRTTGLKIFKR